MYLLFGILCGFIFFISSGVVLYLFTTQLGVSFIFNLIIFWSFNLASFLLIPAIANYFYKKGIVQFSLVLLYLYGVLMPLKNKVRHTVGEIIWQLLDCGHDANVSLLLARFGHMHDNSSDIYSLSFARYLLRNSDDVSTALRITESVLSNRKSARAWFIRGVSFYKLGKIKFAIRSLERAREYSNHENDVILNGTTYFYLGLCWKKNNNPDYAQDHILKASVILGHLPVGKEAAGRI
ncbi:MAG: hypothetical protein PF689_06695 [Deltaproteobacteria bacterium]|jgi:tetratricopeptide (TPR) repeat protein|nr:hypothetical protein [Deltaproteobacteria bacterium]